MMFYVTECRRLIGPATSRGISFTSTISVTCTLPSLVIWTLTTGRRIMHSGETTFLLSLLGLLVSTFC